MDFPIHKPNLEYKVSQLSPKIKNENSCNLKKDFFDPFSQSPPNEFLLNLMKRMNNIKNKNELLGKNTQ